MSKLIYLHIFFLVGFGLFCIPLGMAYVFCESSCSLYPYLDIVFYSVGLVFLINLVIFGLSELGRVIEDYHEKQKTEQVK